MSKRTEQLLRVLEIAHRRSQIGVEKVMAQWEAEATAPELLTALENLLNQLENVSDYCQTCTEEWSVDRDLEHQALCATEAAYGAIAVRKQLSEYII